MDIAPGRRLGPYEIAARIGSGGMGEVFRARDTRIGREVAVKILPASLVTSSDGLRRFQQEARAAGTISHPNLVTIHDVGEDGGTPYIVMELLEGETLRAKIGDGVTEPCAPRIPLRKVIEYATQLASGIAAAHEKGIVHRDLKPENIFITPDGRLKIFDFGLARMSLPAEEDDLTIARPHDHTLTAPGTIMGTAGYMAPEQVRGDPTDHRTDIFAFGVVLYEMLCGRRAFRRKSTIETMHAILAEDPPLGGIVPAVFERILRRCLEKQPGERFQSARDLAFALEALGTSGTDVLPAVARPPARVRAGRTRAALVAAAVVLAAIALGFAAYNLGRNGARDPHVQFRQLTFDSGLETQPALAPDGKTFAFVRAGDIFLQRVDGRTAINLTADNPSEDAQPAFSPDGSEIAFRSARDGGGIFVMGATGESVRRVASEGFNPAWSPDGKEIAYATEGVGQHPRARSASSRIWIVRLADGAKRKLNDDDAVQPSWSPGGARIAFWTVDGAGRRNIRTADVRTGRSLAVTDDNTVNWNPVWSPDGRELFFSSDRDGTLNVWRIAIDQETGATQGEPRPQRVPSASAGYLSLSQRGDRLLFATQTEGMTVRAGAFEPETLRFTLRDAPVLDGSLMITSAAVSPDGTQIAFSTRGPQEDIFVCNADGSGLRQLTDDDDRDRGVSWYPDGKRLLFHSSRSGSYEAWSIATDGSGLLRLTQTAAPGLTNPVMSPDGRRLAYQLSLSSDAAILSLDDRLTVKLPALPGGKGTFLPERWSPDGTRLAGRVTGNGVGGIAIYTLATKTYQRIAEEGFGPEFLDNGRLIYASNAKKKFCLADLGSGAVRELEPLPQPGSILVWRRHVIVANVHREGDVWLATLRTTP